jgi:hypothetical protein
VPACGPTATQTLAFAVPILPGKTDVDRAAMESCRSGERQADHAASRARAGITRESVWIQSTPGGDVPVVVLGLSGERPVTLGRDAGHSLVDEADDHRALADRGRAALH